MTETTKRIVAIAERLDPERQRLLLEIAEDMARPRSFYETMSAHDRDELERSLQEADRGEGVTQEDLNARLDAIVAPTLER
jgi:predicted transcriptional regulator